MTREEELLVVLIEECAEVQKEASKILRFGASSCHPGDPNQTTNSELLKIEILHVRAMVEMISKEGIIEPGIQYDEDKIIAKKKENVEKFMHFKKDGVVAKSVTKESFYMCSSVQCKCGENIFTIKFNGSNAGAYCSDCNQWIKWLNKSEKRTCDV